MFLDNLSKYKINCHLLHIWIKTSRLNGAYVAINGMSNFDK